ncbi:futalosine hydrolase [Streptomyces sp. NPDC006879]|uniref:futalosine hydrolase n=1 Tax=Streptomyces sp. NPDC006879 TaxID=3364767 RepID=UPI00369595D7
MRALIVTAVAAETDSVATALAPYPDTPVPVPRVLPGGRALSRYDVPGLALDLLTTGVGPAAAAAGTATALALAAAEQRPYHLVLSVGIGGGFQPSAPVGSLVVADAIVAADLGADTPGDDDGPDGYLSVEELGFGRCVHLPQPELSARAAEATGALLAPVLTVSTVTGTAARAAELAVRHPLAGAEAMEGFGVAEAAAGHGLPFLEIRAVSNPVGPRDRAAWRIGEALASLAEGLRTLVPVLADWGHRHDR